MKRYLAIVPGMAMALVLALTVSTSVGQDGDGKKSKNRISAEIKDGKVIITLANGEVKVVELDSKDGDGSAAGQLVLLTDVKKQDSDGESSQKYEAVIIGHDGKQRVIALEGLPSSDGRMVLLNDATETNERVRALLKLRGVAVKANAVVDLQDVTGAKVDTVVRLGSLDGGGRFMIGVSCNEVPDSVRAQITLKEGGLHVADVIADSPASEFLKHHDIIARINGELVMSTNELVSAVQDAGNESKQLNLRVLRRGGGITVKLTPVERKKLDPAKITGKLLLDSGATVRLNELMDLSNEAGAIYEWKVETPKAGLIVPRIIVPRIKLVPPQSDSVDLAAQIEDLRKQIEELKEAIKDR